MTFAVSLVILLSFSCYSTNYDAIVYCDALTGYPCYNIIVVVTVKQKKIANLRVMQIREGKIQIIYQNHQNYRNFPDPGHVCQFRQYVNHLNLRSYF